MSVMEPSRNVLRGDIKRGLRGCRQQGTVFIDVNILVVLHKRRLVRRRMRGMEPFVLRRRMGYSQGGVLYKHQAHSSTQP